MTRCECKTLKGKRCSRKAVDESKFCRQHSNSSRCQSLVKTEPWTPSFVLSSGQPVPSEFFDVFEIIPKVVLSHVPVTNRKKLKEVIDDEEAVEMEDVKGNRIRFTKLGLLFENPDFDVSKLSFYQYSFVYPRESPRICSLFAICPKVWAEKVENVLKRRYPKVQVDVLSVDTEHNMVSFNLI